MGFSSRDDLLSGLVGVVWPAGVLWEVLGLAGQGEVLDVGAGQGALLREWRGRGHLGRLVGVDPVPPVPPVPESGVVVGQAEALPFDNEVFDVVVMLRVLAHVHDGRLALREALRVLCRGGRLVVASHGAGHLRQFWAALGVRGMAGPEDFIQATLSSMGLFAQRVDVRLPVTLNASHVQRLLYSYERQDATTHFVFPLQDELHLTVFIHVRGERG